MYPNTQYPDVHVTVFEGNDIPLLFLYVFPFYTTQAQETSIARQFTDLWLHCYKHARQFYPFGPLNDEDQTFVNEICLTNFGLAMQNKNFDLNWHPIMKNVCHKWDSN